jgi:16S rRNA (guanine527-N7)-methyltransferase
LSPADDPAGPPTDPAALPAPARQALGAVLELLAGDPTAPSAVTDRTRAWQVHVADSLTGFDLAPLRSARRVCDLGAGAGFPGLVIAAARPACEVDLLDSVSRKCEFMRRALAAASLANARVICARSEAWAAGDGREAYDVVTARAVGRLSTLAELASPLLADGGHLIAWKGRRDPDEERELERAAPTLAMEPLEVAAVGERAGSTHRHLHLIGKRGATPERLPRRPGMAKKRPPGAH